MAVKSARSLTLVLPLVASLAIAPAARGQVLGETESRFRAGPMDVTLRYSEDRVRGMERELKSLLSSALERYTQLFGGPPRGSDGQPLSMIVLRVHSDAVGGVGSEAGMVQLLIGRQPLYGYYDWRMMLLHELVHLWSGQSFRNAGPAEQWFNEGAAEFYAMQTAARLGLVDDIDAIRNMATAIGFYASARDQQRLTFTEAGQQQPSLHHFMITHGGATATLLLDYELRSKTTGTKSMDDVMRWMYANFDASSKRYSTLDIARGVRAATNQDMTEFFARFIMGRLPLPVSATINLGELGRAMQSRNSGEAAPDTVLQRSLGIERRR